MSDREIEVNRGWVVQNTAYRRLSEKGYFVAGFVDKGADKYALYRKQSMGREFEFLHEFNTPEELNNMVKLLLDE